ncbi:hypothetical protein NDR87_20015 [Nocardia sp. CDC159]|uniref:DUF2637 domain-containing protein n=1 Tax=Nocardia pulmonis TaxID=2951408 RepID=A0A9X2IY39_9NOCA|nr:MULTISPECIES: hypothetical protein [Nocardia]MCM6776018.1 hypothetical protein [Nocardia pulmonis]MCM6788655.1 hypothetical protein [Nocardia sp. CDC159]
MKYESGNSEIETLAQRVAIARGKLPLQTDPALFEELSEAEIAAERELAEWIRAQRRRQRRRAVAAELAAEKRERRVALSVRRADDADVRWHRRALAARRRVANPDARLAQLYRRAEWTSRALIGVVVLGMLWSGVNVQQNLVPSGDMRDPLYWLSYGFEAMISIPIIAIMVVATTAARWGREIPRGKVVFLEATLLGVTIALNSGPHLVNGAPARAAEAAVAPLMVGVVIWLHAWVATRYAQLIDAVPLPDHEPRTCTTIPSERTDLSTPPSHSHLPTPTPSVLQATPRPLESRPTPTGHIHPAAKFPAHNGHQHPAAQSPSTNGEVRPTATSATHPTHDRNHENPAAPGLPHDGRVHSADASHTQPTPSNGREYPGAQALSHNGHPHPGIPGSGPGTQPQAGKQTDATYPLEQGDFDQAVPAQARNASHNGRVHPAATSSAPNGHEYRSEKTAFANGHVHTATSVARPTPLRGHVPPAAHAPTHNGQARAADEPPAPHNGHEYPAPQPTSRNGHRHPAEQVQSGSGNVHPTATFAAQPMPQLDRAPLDAHAPSRSGHEHPDARVPQHNGHAHPTTSESVQDDPQEIENSAAATHSTGQGDGSQSARKLDDRRIDEKPTDASTPAPGGRGKGSAPTEIRPSSNRKAGAEHPYTRRPSGPSTTEDEAATNGKTRTHEAIERATQLALDDAPIEIPLPRGRFTDVEPDPDMPDEFDPEPPNDDTDDIAADIDDVEVWAVARAISERRLSKLPVEQLAEVLTLADESWTPAAIGAAIGLPGSRILGILEAARRIRRPYAIPS